MLIPGTVPNIIAANKLRISNRDWPNVGVLFGLLMVGIYFGILYW